MSLFGRILLTAMLSLGLQAVRAGVLDAVRESGVLRHIGVPYAHFVTGSGDGLDVDLMKAFADYLGVRYEYVRSDWSHVIGDLIGRKARRGVDGAELLGPVPVRGDVIANGLTILPWRKQVLAFAEPSFPSGVWLIARADSSLKPIRPAGSRLQDIRSVKSLLGGRRVLALRNTCLDPDLYDLAASGADIRLQPEGRKLNEMVPAILNGDAESTLLDVPDALIALQRWPGRIKVIGPVSELQYMAPAFRKDAPRLREAFNRFFAGIWNDGTYERWVRKYYPAVFDYFADFFSRHLFVPGQDSGQAGG